MPAGFSKMKKENISKYCKLATVLLINIVPVRGLISANEVEYGEFVDSLALLIILFFLVVFNIWAVILYFFTKHIERLWLRDTVFYVLLLLSVFCIPCLLFILLIS